MHIEVLLHNSLFSHQSSFPTLLKKTNNERYITVEDIYKLYL